MEIYNSEQEQVEALKAWWDKNGRTALMALAVFLVSVVGWQKWDAHRKGVAEAASTHYQKMLEMVGEDNANAMEAGRALIANYPDTVYAGMTSLVLAKLSVEQNDLEGAVAHLTSAMEKIDQPELAALARLRLARVQLAQGKPDAALATLAAGNGGAASDELRGDILLSQDKRDEARAAYGKALEGYGEVADKRSLVQMKLDDLAVAVAAAESPAE